MTFCYQLVFMPPKWIPHYLSSLLVLLFVIFWSMLMIFCLRVATLFCFNALYSYWDKNLSFATWVMFITFWVLRFNLLIWVLCYDNINIHLTSSLGLVWYLANLLILLSLHPKLSYYQILCFLMLHAFVKLWELLNISLLRDQIFALLLTKSVNLCMLLQIFIGLPLNVFCVILRVQQHMTYILLVVLPLHYIALHMQIGQVVLLIENLQVVILCSLVKR